MYDTRLLQGDRELNDNDFIEVEIQTVTAPSWEKKHGVFFESSLFQGRGICEAPFFASSTLR